MRYSIFVAILAAVGTWGIRQEQQSTSWTVGQTVQTSSGPVQGHAARNDSQVSEYLGIPYGQAPVEKLRFAAPVAFTSSTPLNGSAFGFSCPVRDTARSIPTVQAASAANLTSVGVEILYDLLSDTNSVYNEDCLNLNIWTQPQTGEAKKAVLVWIYGGGFNRGSSAIPAYNGANLAGREDVVVVSFNYRLTIFGFPGNPLANNLGLLDQRLAVEWVRTNIANFGGDPARITLFGQSAGGASVDFYSFAWNSNPIAAGFIAESGSAFAWGLPFSAASRAELWYNVTSTLGCGNAVSDQATVLSCMRAQNVNTILEALPLSASSALSSFGPAVDDTLVFSNYSQRTPASVPMLIGNNDYESGLFRVSLALGDVTQTDVFWDDFTLVEYTCPCGIRANASIAAKNPTWRYRYFGEFPNMMISPQAGAWHEAEIPIVFDTAPIVPPPTDAQVSIANYMRGAWAAFAKDPTSGLTNYGWPMYDPTRDTLIRLAFDNITGLNLISPYKYDADCVFVNVSDTNSSNWRDYPDLGATITPTPTGTSMPNRTETTTATAATVTHTKNAGASVGNSMWTGVGIGALVAACLL